MSARHATPQDIPALLEIGRRFTAAAGMPFDEQALTQTLEQLMAADDGVLLVTAEATGVLGGIAFRNPFNTERTAQELFWWAEQGGLDLLAAFESWAAEHGATRVVMVCLEALEPERVERIYRRRGYVPLERGFERAITWQ